MTKEQVYQVVNKVIMEVLPDLDQDAVRIEKSLKELGANSIDRMEVVTRSMEELGIVVPLMSFAQVSNIQGLVDVLTENYAAAPQK